MAYLQELNKIVNRLSLKAKIEKPALQVTEYLGFNYYIMSKNSSILKFQITKIKKQINDKLQFVNNQTIFEIKISVIEIYLDFVFCILSFLAKA